LHNQLSPAEINGDCGDSMEKEINVLFTSGTADLRSLEIENLPKVGTFDS